MEMKLVSDNDIIVVSKVSRVASVHFLCKRFTSRRFILESKHRAINVIFFIIYIKWPEIKINSYFVRGTLGKISRIKEIHNKSLQKAYWFEKMIRLEKMSQGRDEVPEINIRGFLWT